MSPAGENSSGGPAPANARKRDAKAEDPEGGTDCWEDIERSMTVPCVAATVLGMMLFTVLAALAFKQVSPAAVVFFCLVRCIPAVRSLNLPSPLHTPLTYPANLYPDGR